MGGGGGKKNPTVTSVEIAPPANPPIIFAGEGAAFHCHITIVGKNFFPLDLTGPNVEIGYLDGGKIKPIEGVSITSGQVDVSGESASFEITVTAEQDTPTSYNMAVSVYGKVSNGIPLIISPPSAVHTVTVVPATEHGEAFAGTSGELKYTITVEGETTAFPIDLADDTKVTFVINDDDISDLPEGISVLSGDTIVGSGGSGNITFRVNVPAGEAYEHSVIARVMQRASDPFTLEVKPVDLTGTPVIKGNAEDGETLTVDISDLPGTRPVSYCWQVGSGEIYNDIEGEENPTYIIGEIAWEKRVRVLVEREGFTNVVYSDPTAIIPNPTGETLPNTVKISITGTPKITNTLTAHLEGFPDGKTPTYQWEHGTGGNFSDISGAEGSTYTIQPADVNLTIRVRVSAAGYRNHVHSAATAVVTYPTVTEQFETLFAMTTLPETYTVTVYADESIGVQELNFNRQEIEITVKGAATTNNTLTLDLAKSKDPIWIGAGYGPMFRNDIDDEEEKVALNNVTLKLENVKLVGINNNSYPLIYNRGTLIINEGTIITGNTNNTDIVQFMGGGINNGYGAEITMNGGSITGNTAVGGGGITNSGQFTMNSGTITGNTAITNGGGVNNYSIFTAWNANFDMYGGSITNNTATPNNNGKGGGMYMYGASCQMFDGEFSGNTAAAGGGITSQGDFNMLGGTISANTSVYGGSGIENYGGYLQIENGIIYGRNAGSNSNIAPNEVYATIVNNNYGRMYYGVFDIEVFENMSFKFTPKGNLPDTDLTVSVKDGKLQIPLSPIGLKITGIDSKYHGMTGRLFIWDEANNRWYDIDNYNYNWVTGEKLPPTTITADTEFRWPFDIIPEGLEWDFKLEIWNDGELIDQYIAQEIEINMGVMGITSAAFTTFIRQELAAPVTKIIIENVWPIMAASAWGNRVYVELWALPDELTMISKSYPDLPYWDEVNRNFVIDIAENLQSGTQTLKFRFVIAFMSGMTMGTVVKELVLTPGENTIDFASIQFLNCPNCYEGPLTRPDGCDICEAEWGD